MDTSLGVVGIVAAAVVGFIAGLKKSGRVGNADATFFQTNPGSGGFVAARILKRKMKGRTFHWNRVGTIPAAGSHFEIRPKPGQPKILNPPIPSGVNDLYADVPPSVPGGTKYQYSLWQVLADNSEKELDDPELEIGS